MNIGKIWQILAYASPCCCIVSSWVCEPVLGATQNALSSAFDRPESVGSAASELGWDAGATSSHKMVSVLQAKIAWETPVSPHAHAPQTGSIAASLAAEELARWNVGGNSDATYVSRRSGYHPGTRVIVDLDTIGPPRTHVNRAAATRHFLAEFRNFGYWPYRLCYESAAREIHSKGGEVWLHVRINKKGRILASRLPSANTDPPQFAACILDATRSINLLHPPAVGAAIKLRVRVFPGDAPLGVTRKSPDNKASIAPQRIRDSLNSVRNTVESCIREGVSRDPSLWGRLAVLLQFDKNGEVARSDEYDSHFPDASVVKCVCLALREMRLIHLAEPATLIAALRVGALPTSIGEANVEPHTAPPSNSSE